MSEKAEREKLYKLNIKFLRMLTLLMAIAVFFVARGSDAVSAFIASPHTNGESVSVYVYDLTRGEVVESYNEKKPLLPASITKALTIATTLQATGIDYCYVTKVYADGGLKDGVLHGNLFIEGSGDPSLNSKAEPRTPDFVAEVVNSLKNKGVTTIAGSLVIDQSIFEGPSTPPSWGGGDLAHSYGAGQFGFNFENNSNGKGSVKNPAAVFEMQLRRALSNAGIAMGTERVEPEGKRKLLMEHVSAPIDDIMRSCMRRSDNMFAESLLRTYSLARKHKGSTAEGARLEMDYWRKRGIDSEGVNVVDGSGLSRSNRLTAKFLGEVLAQMADNVDYVSYFPLAGQEGTLRNFLKDSELDSYIAMKTGSMNGIQCYAGYKLDEDYAPTHVVVVMVNNMTSARSNLRKEVATMLLEIFKDNESLNRAN